jgi:DNA-binding transcriptional regulator YhcF (GntR family)
MGKDRDLLVIYWYLSQDAAFGTRFERKELGGEEVSRQLEPGEILTTMRGLAAEAGVDQATALRKIKLLQLRGFIESITKVNRYFCVIKLARPERGQRYENQKAPEPSFNMTGPL